MSGGKATVKGVLSGDTIVIVGSTTSGPPPTMQISLASVKAPMIAIRTMNRETEDEPYGFQAREWLRNLILGAAVDFRVEYEFNGRKYGRVCFNGENVALGLLKMGYAKMMPKREKDTASDYDALALAEEDAKAAEAGVWGPADRLASVRTVLWSQSEDFDNEKFFENNKNVKVNAQIESIRDGGYYRVMILPGQLTGIDKDTYVCIAMHLSGVQCDGFKRDADGNEVAETYAAESKHFVEIRLLNRDVQIRLESIDSYQSLYGSIYHPNGNIACSLLKNGFAKVNDRSGRCTESPSTLREAQREAQKKNLRKWRDFVSSAIEKKQFVGKVIEISSGDCITVKDLDTFQEIRLYMASVRAKRMGTADRANEPWAWEAKEFCRKTLIGKKVNITIEYAKDQISAPGTVGPPPSDSSGRYFYASIFFDKNIHLGTALCAAGFAEVMNHRAEDECSEYLDDMTEAMNLAKEKKLGIWSNDEPIHRVNDLMGPSNAIRAQSLTNSMTRLRKVAAVVEHVIMGSRFKIRIPKENCTCAFATAGATAPSASRKINPTKSTPAEPFANESIAFAREHVMQHDVMVQIYACNRGGTFYGQMWVKVDGKEREWNEMLLEQGMASCQEYLEVTPSMSRLQAAEKAAQEKKIGIWSLEDRLNAVVEEGEQNISEEMGKMGISHVNNWDDFFVQPMGSPKLDQVAADIRTAIRDNKAPELKSAQKGTVCLAKFSADGEWYRARVEAKSGAKVRVFFIDYGNSDEVSLSSMRTLPNSLITSRLPALATRCALSGVRTNKDNSADLAFALSEWMGTPLSCLAERIVLGKKYVCLKPASGLSVNEECVKAGQGFLDKKYKGNLQKALEKMQEEAKRNHYGVWQFGDHGVDDEDEEYY